MKEYVTLAAAEPSLTVISKSKFIAYAARADSAGEGAEFVNSVAKKHFDATHNCYAYIVGDRTKFSDDGEPSGTAGLPILDALKKQNLDHVCVVVTRYFGGTKLGAGGLARAYGGAAASVLTAAKKVEIRLIAPFEATIPYALLKPVQTAAEKTVKIVSVAYGADVTLKINALAPQAGGFAAWLTDFTNGQAKIIRGEEFLGEY